MTEQDHFSMRYEGCVIHDVAFNVPIILTYAGSLNIRPGKMAVIRVGDGRVYLSQIGVNMAIVYDEAMTDKILKWLGEGGAVQAIVQKDEPDDEGIMKTMIGFFMDTDALLRDMDKFQTTLYGPTDFVTNSLIGREMFLEIDPPGYVLTIDGITCGTLWPSTVQYLSHMGKSVTDVRYFLKKSRINPKTDEVIWDITVAWPKAVTP